ncbi:hypothetical protein BLA9940_05944 [Burkholderia aenigmatica]|uniref:hypothetical protein n=1 Tax=Burkholderia cepacia complex TaxID=87882 RepID=UPI000F081179|nr:MULTISPECIES: hypothetical protein [Burkholderia cepacia complex]AYQ37636.1 hypothetical protein CVS37_05560 [Burkholderia lata]VWC98177.1 hypothetical protein BLA9940_05944 [Burkholderia aenigmatica]
MDNDTRDQLIRDARALSGLSLIFATTNPETMLETVGAGQLSALFELMRTLACKIEDGLMEVRHA